MIDSVKKGRPGQPDIVYSHAVTQVPLSEFITDIPEFHDCQRFVVGRSYDSLYAIFASFRLSRLLSDLDKPATRATYSITGADGVKHATMPVATIWTDGGYAPLGIERGFNCLFLYRQPTGADPNGWGAKMVPIGVADSNCLGGQLQPDATGTPLDVKASQPSGDFTDADYPAVARWDWDPKNRRQYIGIKCGPAWCEVGSRGFQPSATYSGPAVNFSYPGIASFTADQLNRVTQIKGWYDAQQLDIVVGGKQVPSAVYGVIIPNPGLEPAPEVTPGRSAYHGNWVHVASLWLDGEYKWNLKAGMNELWVCHEAPGGGRCNVPLDQPPLSPPWDRRLTRCDTDPDDNGKWWAKIVSASGEARYRCVKRRGHGVELAKLRAKYGGTLEIPGSARWRWLLDDAGEWTKCGAGCCTGQ